MQAPGRLRSLPQASLPLAVQLGLWMASGGTELGSDILSDQQGGEPSEVCVAFPRRNERGGLGLGTMER